MRALFREHMGEIVKIRKLIEAVSELENSKALPTRFEAREMAKGWKLKAASSVVPLDILKQDISSRL